MTRTEALSVLGLAQQANQDEIRDAYRGLIRRLHPDVTDDPQAAEATVLVIEAYTVASSEQPADITVSLSDSLEVVFEQVREAAEVIGQVSYVDSANATIETIVEFDGWPAASLQITLLVRGNQTLADCVLESLGTQPGPPIHIVVRELRNVTAALAE